MNSDDFFLLGEVVFVRQELPQESVPDAHVVPGLDLNGPVKGPHQGVGELQMDHGRRPRRERRAAIAERELPNLFWNVKAHARFFGKTQNLTCKSGGHLDLQGESSERRN